MMFISEIPFLLDSKLFVMNDTVFDEGEKASKMYFIAKGTVILYHQKSHTYIKQLGENCSFGEASFFSDKNRCCTAKSNSFTEMLVLDAYEFHKTLSNHPYDEEVFNRICKKIIERNDYSDINIKCFI